MERLQYIIACKNGYTDVVKLKFSLSIGILYVGKIVVYSALLQKVRIQEKTPLGFNCREEGILFF